MLGGHRDRLWMLPIGERRRPGKKRPPGYERLSGMQAINAFLIRERADIGEAAEEALEVGAIPIF